MVDSELNHLIKMINQIADNIDSAASNSAEHKVADHIKRFWAPSMKEKIIDYSQCDGERLQPVAKAAISLLVN